MVVARSGGFTELPCQIRSLAPGGLSFSKVGMYRVTRPFRNLHLRWIWGMGALRNSHGVKFEQPRYGGAQLVQGRAGYGAGGTDKRVAVQRQSRELYLVLLL